MRGESLDVSVSGSWTAANLQALEPLVETAVREAAGRRLHVDIHGLGEIDTFGACLLNRMIRDGSPSATASKGTGAVTAFAAA